MSAPQATNPAEFSVLKKIIFVFLLLLGLFVLLNISFLIAQPRLLALAEHSLVSGAPGEVRFSSLRRTGFFSPVVELRDVTVRARQTQELLLKAPFVRAYPLLESLWKGKILWGKIEFEQPEVYFQKTSEGSWDSWRAGPLFFDVSGGLKTKVIELFDAVIFFDEKPLEPGVDLVLRHTQALMTRKPEDGAVDFDAFGALDNGRDFTVSGSYFEEEDRADLTFSLDQQRWMFEGAVLRPSSGRSFEGNLDISGVPLANLLVFWGGEAAGVLDGEALFQGEGQLTANVVSEIPDRLLMRGALDIRDGRFLQINFLRETLEQVLALTGGTFKAETFGDGDYDFLLVSGTLPFELLQSGLDILHGEALLQDMLVKHSDFMIEAGVSYGLRTQEMDFRGRLVLLDMLSAALVKEYPVLGAFLNPQKRLVFPFVYRGLLKEPVFRLEETYLKDKWAESAPGAETPASPAPEPVPAAV